VPDANPAPPLVRGTIPSWLPNEIATQLQSLARHLLDHPDACNFLHFEQSLHQQFVKAADMISEQVFLEMISKPDFIEQAIDSYRSKGYRIHSRNRTTTVQLKGGRTVRIKTVYMLPRQSSKKGRKRGVGKRGRQGKGIYPVLKMLGIAHQSSPALQNDVTISALNNPFVEATETLKRHGVEISEKRVRTISESVGKAALKDRDKELEQFSNGTLQKGNTFAGKRVVVAIDGGRTRTRQAKKGKKKQGQQRQGYHTDWKEPKLFTLYAIDETGRKQKKQLLPYNDGTITGRDSFKQLFKMYLYKTGIVDASQIIFIGDGAVWIWNIIDEIINEMNINPEIIDKVLDFYHAVEHLWEVIDALPNLTQKQKKRLLKKFRTQLKKGKIDSLIETLGRKANRNQDAYRKLSYFHGHEDKCRYDQFIKKNIPIGSGAIESAVRRIVNLRLKGAGMFWLKHNAEAFLHLRCQLKSGRWDEFFLKRITPA
jgi:hypothetical protein